MIARLHFIYFCPLWIGIRNGNTINRIGYSHPLVQDRTQNVVHKWFGPGRTNFFNRYDHFYQGPTNYYGYYNPFSLW
ncbi:MAG: polymorphic toxin type 23 domain-containing protein [Dysgonamonadaceae bacterium]|nr:polymorphic toxin type 23 domain-containing protein [Dysgonamonadaceae bacterium]